MRNFVAHDKAIAALTAAKLVVCMLCIALASLWWLNAIDIALHQPDSGSYLRFDEFRSVGYPAFLNVLNTVGVAQSAIPAVQLSLFFLSLSFLALACLNFSRSLILTMGLIIAIGLNPAIVRFNFTILTEALTFSSLFLCLALTLRLSHQRRCVKTWLLLGLFIGIALALKPAVLPLIAIPLVLAFSWLLDEFKQASLAQQIKPIAAAALSIAIGISVVTAAGSSYRHAVHDRPSDDSFFGVQLIGKLAFAEFDPQQTSYPQAAQLWQQIMQPSVEARKRFTQTSTQRYLFALNTYDFLRFDNLPAIQAAMGVAEKEIAGATTQLSIDVIKLSPWNYLEDVWLNYQNLWTIGETQSAKVAKSYNQQRKLAIEAYNDKIPEPYLLSEDASIKYWIVKLLVYTALALHCIVLLLGLRLLISKEAKSNPSLNSLLAFAIFIQGYFLLTALFQAALTRYAMVAWPVHCLSLVIAVAWIRDRWLDQPTDPSS